MSTQTWCPHCGAEHDLTLGPHECLGYPDFTGRRKGTHEIVQRQWVRGSLHWLVLDSFMDCGSLVPHDVVAAYLEGQED